MRHRIHFKKTTKTTFFQLMHKCIKKSLRPALTTYQKTNLTYTYRPTETGKRPRRAIKFRLHTNFPLRRVWNIVFFSFFILFFVMHCTYKICAAYNKLRISQGKWRDVDARILAMYLYIVVLVDLYLYTTRYNIMRCITTLRIKPNEPVKGGELRNGASAFQEHRQVFR